MPEEIKKKASAKKLVVFTIIFSALFIPMNTFVLGWMNRTGTTLMDFIIGGYSSETAYEILTIIGGRGRMIYLQLLVLDCILSFLYLLLSLCLISMLLKKVSDKSSKADLLLLAPVAAMTFDLLENLMTFCMLQNYPFISSRLAVIGSIGTTLKYVFLGIAFFGAVVIFIYVIVRQKSRTVK